MTACCFTAACCIAASFCPFHGVDTDRRVGHLLSCAAVFPVCDQDVKAEPHGCWLVCVLLCGQLCVLLCCSSWKSGIESPVSCSMCIAHTALLHTMNIGAQHWALVAELNGSARRCTHASCVCQYNLKQLDVWWRVLVNLCRREAAHWLPLAVLCCKPLHRASLALEAQMALMPCSTQ